MSEPQNSFEPHIEPKNSPLGPQKVKKKTELSQKSKIRIEGTIENKSWSTT